MEYQQIINLLDNTPNQLTKFSTINWAKNNDDARGMYSKNNQIKFKNSKLKLSLYDYSDAYIRVNRTLTITRAGAEDNAKRLDERNKRSKI